MNNPLMVKWIAALRSGKYKQGRGRLRDGDAYCCLGVLCDISGMGEWVEDASGSTTSFRTITGESLGASVPYMLAERAGFGREFGKLPHELMKMNDNWHESFDEIANFLESTFITKEDQ